MAYSAAIQDDVKRVFESNVHRRYISRCGDLMDADEACEFAHLEFAIPPQCDQWLAQWKEYSEDNSDYWAATLDQYADRSW